MSYDQYDPYATANDTPADTVPVDTAPVDTSPVYSTDWASYVGNIDSLPDSGFKRSLTDILNANASQLPASEISPSAAVGDVSGGKGVVQSNDTGIASRIISYITGKDGLWADINSKNNETGVKFIADLVKGGAGYLANRSLRDAKLNSMNAETALYGAKTAQTQAQTANMGAVGKMQFNQPNGLIFQPQNYLARKANNGA